MTPSGERPVEQLAVGDLVMTLDSGARPIRRVGAQTPLPARATPIHFAVAALGCGSDLLVSPTQRVLIRAPDLAPLIGTRESLVAAQDLVNGRTIIVKSGACMSFHHFMLDRPEIVWACGVPVDCSYPDASSTDLARPVVTARELDILQSSLAA
jgi:hypothetical protein